MRPVTPTLLFVLLAVPSLGCGRADRPQALVAAPAAEPADGRVGPVGTFPDEEITVKGKARQYRLVVPPAVSAGKPVPLLFAFHGALDSKDFMPVYSHLDDLAKKHGFILVYPNAQYRYWLLVPDLARDDLAFFDALYERLSASYRIDRDRVFLTGMSNGAYFCHLVASQRSEVVAAIAAHSGGLGALQKKPDVKRKYAVLVIHGADDSIVKVEESRKVRDAYKRWGYEVEYVEVPNLNHFWAHKVGVNDKIWEFLMAHPRR
jgi:polyhydroxybutyrate depolymerase